MTCSFFRVYKYPYGLRQNKAQNRLGQANEVRSSPSNCYSVLERIPILGSPSKSQQEQQDAQTTEGKGPRMEQTVHQVMRVQLHLRCDKQEVEFAKTVHPSCL
jgi:hypothetical protein